MNESTSFLILPCNTSQALAFAVRQRNEGHRVIGASSLPVENTQGYYDDYIKLPWLTEAAFDQALLGALEATQCRYIYAPQYGIYDRIRGLLADFAHSATLVPLPETDMDALQFAAIYARASDYAKFINQDTERPLSLAWITSLLTHFIQIPGQCSEEKFCALLYAGLCFPRGDVVEIGSFYGKSAFVLGAIARLRQSGKLLCIDPWHENKVPQKRVHEVLKTMNQRRERSTVHARFVNYLLPYLYDNMNYLQMTSEQAHTLYQHNTVISSDAFGQTDYAGKIACLHIDGNHDIEFVSQEIAQWAGYIVPGGWIIFDDYYWCYGDGPKQAADAYIATHQQHIRQCFVCGGALFVHKV